MGITLLLRTYPWKGIDWKGSDSAASFAEAAARNVTARVRRCI